MAEVVQVARADALNVTYRVDGRVGERLLYRGEEIGFEFIETGRSYAFDADGGLPARIRGVPNKARLPI